MDRGDLEYVGFWLRVAASLVDGLLLVFVTTPLLWVVYGPSYWTRPGLVAGPADVAISWVLPAVATLAFWFWRQATPGKLAVRARIVDASTGAPPSTGQYIVRYLGYFVSAIPICLGMIWVAIDDRKQGWHDKLANTLVVRDRDAKPPSVVFR
jgi:uncharacterized RDD family membrane protein YckC